MKVEKAAERQSVTTSPTYVFLSGFLCLSAALANFLIYQGYPLLRVEVLFSFSLLAVVSIAMSFLYFYSPGIVKHFWEALIISILVDMHFIDNFAYTLLALAVIFIFLIFLRVSPLRLLAIFGGLVLVTTLFGLRGDVKWPLEISSALGQTQRVERPDYGSKPAIVHIILDEHIGFGGFPAGAKSREARDKLVAYYLDRGFRIYPRAYSEHMHTINSIPSMLNF